MSKKKAIIIGSGLSGMSAASYLQMNGFDTEIYEMHSIPGGLCTSWKENGYLIDGCIHFMIGTSKGESTYPFWNGLIDMEQIDFAYYDNHCSVHDGDSTITFYSDVDKLEHELLTKAPEDSAQILWLTKCIRKFLTLQLPTEKPFETMSLYDKTMVGLRILPYARYMIKGFKKTNQDFTDSLQNPAFKKAFNLVFENYLPVFSTMLTLVWRHKKQMGYPKGGAINIALKMAKNYKELGGTIYYNSTVSKIITENNKATAIQLENGTTVEADIIISASDGKNTIYNLLDGKYLDQNLKNRYEESMYELTSKTLYVSIGINKDFSHVNHKTYFFLKKPIQIDPKTTLDYLETTHYCCDPASAPEGKSLLTLMPDSFDWEYWHNLRSQDNEKYEAEKLRIAHDIIEALDQEYGDFKEHVDMIDVATPATYIRYTGNWTGGQNSWKAKRDITSKPTAWQIEGLQNFYMTGQWAGVSGGTNLVVMMGNHLAQIICKQNNMPFSFPQK